VTEFGRRWAPVLLGLGIFIFQIGTMPAQTLPADPWVPRAEAEVLLRAGRWGLTPEEAAPLGGLMETPGQYFVHNPATGRYYSKYGLLNTLLSIPPLLITGAPAAPVPWRRLLFALNIYNAGATSLLAVLLFFLARRFAPTGVAVLWTLAALYSGFLWFYTRAQSMEVWHVVFYTAAVLALFRAREEWDRRPRAPVLWLALAAGAVGALFLLRFTYGPLFLWLIAAAGVLSRGRDLRRAGAALSVPLALALVLWAATNAVKFGGPFTTGYGLWVVGGLPHDRFDLAVFPRAVVGFLFSPQRSVFWHYPLLLFALVGLVDFYRRFRKEALLVGGAAIGYFLVFSLTTNWESHAAYGPRYLLPFLPAAALPALGLWGRRDLLARGSGVMAAVLLAGSFWLQTEVNALPFFLPYRLAGPFAQYAHARIDRYFARRPYALIDRDVRRFLQGRAVFPPLEWLKEARGADSSGEAVFVAERVRALAERNYFFGSQRGADSSLGESR